MSRDGDSYVEFVTASQDKLRRIAYAVRSDSDDSRAEDVLQQALVKLYLAWSKVQRKGSEEAFARRVIINADLDDRRRSWHRRRSQVTEDELAQHPARSTDQTDARLGLLDALRRLPPMQRRTVVLRHWIGLSVEETAAELSVATGNSEEPHLARTFCAQRATRRRCLTADVTGGRLREFLAKLTWLPAPRVERSAA